MTTPTKPVYRRLPSFRAMAAPVLLASIFVSTSLRAQVAPTAPASATDTDTVQLSPFVVNSSSEKGWVATQTLAGSRMKTNFDDLAQPISVMTKDFMDDLGIDNYEQAVYYSTNIEGPNEHVDNSSANGQGFGISQPQNDTVVRGLTGATVSHDFFNSSIAPDNYNLDRITISRGPSSILFSMGSPSGVIDATYKRALLTKDLAEVALQITSDSSKRGTFDINRVVVPNKLALRFDGVSDEGIQFIKPNLDRQDRLYGSITYQPFRATSITVNHEHTNWNSQRAATMLPFDSFSNWAHASSVANTIYGTNMPLIDNSINTTTGKSNIPTTTGSNLDPIFGRGGNSPVMLFGTLGNLNGNYQSWSNSVVTRGVQNVPTAISPLNSFDQFSQTVTPQNDPVPLHTNIWGTSSALVAKDDTTDVFLEQKLLPHVFAELAWHHEYYFNQSANTGMDPSTIYVDANKYLPDGVTPNPNVGRYYTQGRATGTQTEDHRDSYRATLSYEFDLRKHLGWVGPWILGHSSIAGMFQQENFIDRNEQYQRGILTNPNIPGAAFPTGSYGKTTGTGSKYWATDGSRDFNTRFYLGGPAGNVASDPFGNLFNDWSFKDAGGNAYSAYLFDSPYKNAQGMELVRSGSGPNGSMTKTETEMLAWQFYTLKDRLTFLYGWRRDKAKDANLQAQYFTRDFSGLYPTWRGSQFGAWNPAQSGITRTYGLVGHVTRWLGLLWDQADTFQPNIGKYDPFGNEYPGATGKATDYGITLNLFSDTLRVRATHFWNSDGPTRAGNVGFNDPLRDEVWNIENTVETLDPSLPTINKGPGQTGYRNLGRANYWVMFNSVSKGNEVDLSWLPTPNWSFIFNYAKNSAVQSDIGTPWINYINDRLPVWKSLNVPEGGTSNPRDVNGDGSIGTWTWDTAPYDGKTPSAETLSQYFATQIQAQSLAFIQAVDGNALDQGRSRRWNAIGQYTFSEGRLKGLSLNAAVRFRSAPNLGYGIKTLPSGLLAYDVSKPVLGRPTYGVDAGIIYRGRISKLHNLQYRVQLNVRNVFDSYDLQPAKGLTNGDYGRYFRVTPRTYIFTVTFDY